MENTEEIKRQLHRACAADVDKRIATLREILRQIDASRTSETKSSVGDKYETGRSMLHLEEAKGHHQLTLALQLRQELDRIDLTKTSRQVQPGSLVVTNRGVYYVAIGLGKVQLRERMYYCVSVDSPVGQSLRHQEAGQSVSFNNTELQIESIH